VTIHRWNFSSSGSITDTDDFAVVPAFTPFFWLLNAPTWFFW
jgi:hypothetical protein